MLYFKITIGGCYVDKKIAIAFARLQIISRSRGSNACLRSAYNARVEIKCERTGQIFYFSNRPQDSHHEILLPPGVDTSFKNPSALWNAAEWREKRSDAQIAKDIVLALPDNKIISIQDRIELCHRFIQENFTNNGLGVQLDIHSPHKGEHNWHAHLLVTTRRFCKDGLTLGEKARDLNPTFFKNKIMEGEIWGKIWQECQDKFFMEKGYDLYVDPVGIIAQNHLGPLRMRNENSDLVKTSEERIQMNMNFSLNPDIILSQITKTKSVFSYKDIDRYIKKHVPEQDQNRIREKIFQNDHLLQLYNKEKDPVLGQFVPHNIFTTKEIRSEEEKIKRFSDRIQNQCRLALQNKKIQPIIAKKSLSNEQEAAFKHACLDKRGLVCLQGRAGTGKSYTLSAIHEAYKESRKEVLGLSPTHSVSKDLEKEAGFFKTKTIHKMLFDIKNGKDNIKDIDVIIVDEAGMISNNVMGELLKIAYKNKVKVILVGDDKQLPSVERGGMFHELCKIHGSSTLTEIKRQSLDYQKQISKDMSEGYVKEAIHALNSHGKIHFSQNLQTASTELLRDYINSSLPSRDKLIITHRNQLVGKLNQAVHDILRDKGHIDQTEFECLTVRGKEWERTKFSKGDRVQITKTDAEKGLFNGVIGTLIDLNEKNFTIQCDGGGLISFDPNHFHGFTYGYASTVYKAQGKTKPEVFVLHDSMHNYSLSYVSLTRHKGDMKLYVGEDTAKNLKTLIMQMSQNNGSFSSLSYQTYEDIQKLDIKENFMATIKNFSYKFIQDFKDRFQDNKNFYQFKDSACKMKDICVEQIKNLETSCHVAAISKDKPIFMDTQVKDMKQPTLKLQEDISKSIHNDLSLRI